MSCFYQIERKFESKGRQRNQRKERSPKAKKKSIKSDKNGACVLLHCTGKWHFKTPLNRRFLMQTSQNICFTFYRSQIVFKWQKRCKKRKINDEWSADYIFLDIGL